MPHRPGRRARRRRRSQLGKLLACALAAMSACLAVPGTSWADSSTLTTDSGGLPLVSAAKLSPGHVLERCIVLTTPTVYSSADLAMYVTAEGDLASHLNVTVESGQGGAFSDCTGFTGRLLYVGTLGGLVAGFNAQNPQRVGHYSPTISEVTLRLRFSVQDDNAAQGLTTTAAFWWMPIAPDPTPAPAPTTTVPPASAVPTTPQPSGAPTTSRPAPVPARRSATVGPGPVVPTPPTGLHPGPTPEPVPSLGTALVTTLAPPVGVPFSTGHGKKPAVALVPSRRGGGGGTSPGRSWGHWRPGSARASPASPAPCPWRPPRRCAGPRTPRC